MCNHTIREVIQKRDIFKDADLIAVKNKNETYFILRNNHGLSGLVETKMFREELSKSEIPVVMSVKLFEGMM